MFTIKATNRDNHVKLDDLRKSGGLPAVVYGMGKKPASIVVPVVEFNKIWHKAGESSAIQIVTPEGTLDVLIHDVQKHPITSEPIHADFLIIDMNKKISVSVPLEFVGISPAVKSGMGTLVKVLHEVEVEALPKDLPQVINVDISKLTTLEDQITLADIVLDKNVSLVEEDTTMIVASIAEQKEEEEQVASVDLSQIEVEKKGKKDTEDEEAVEKS